MIRFARALLLVPLALALAAPAGAQTPPPARPATRDPNLPPNAPRLGTTPVAAEGALQEIATAPQAARLEHDVRALVGFGTRHTLSDTVSQTRGIGAARRWIFAEFTRISHQCGGCLQVMYVSDIVKGDPAGRIKADANVVDVVAIQRGRTDPERYVLMQGHYDSRVNDVMDATTDAPGANDDASGVVATIEAARVLSKRTFDATVVYAALAGEEQGLFGGEILAKYARDHNWRLAGVLNNDIVGNTRGMGGLTNNTTARVFAPGIPPTATAAELRRYLYSGGELDTPSRELGRYVVATAQRYVPNLEVQLVYRLDRFGRGGDHTPFFTAGYPAVRLTESQEDYTRQHQTVRVENGIRYGDVPEMVDYPYLARMTAVNATTLASLAWAPAAPDSVTVTGAVTPNTTLKWKAVAASDLAGYRIYWRHPTSGAWERSRFVGNVTEATLENVNIDDYFFGVAAVDRDGNESLPVFPLPGR
ncbi:MAG TPA: M28 family metallopeptidase [Longimicrobiaceae bacterium]|nr:M28 family metallopeptidase [Longimicrobiaceae bacterium]